MSGISMQWKVCTDKTEVYPLSWEFNNMLTWLRHGNALQKSPECKNDPRGLPEVKEAQVECLVGSVQAGQQHAARRRKTLPGNSNSYGHTLSQNQIQDPGWGISGT